MQSPGISPLALHDNARTITSIPGQKLASSAQKTVTIVSPDLSRAKSEYQQRSATLDVVQPGGSRSFRRCNSDIESVSSKSSSQSSRSLDHDTSKSSSRKSSDNDGLAPRRGSRDSDKWDFDEATPRTANDDILEAIVKESNIVTRRLSDQSTATPVANVAETSLVEVKVDAPMQVPEVRIDVPDEDTARHSSRVDK